MAHKDVFIAAMAGGKVGALIGPDYTDYKEWGTVPDDAQCCAFSSDGTKLAIGYNDRPGLKIISTSDWSVVFESTDDFRYIKSLAFSPDSSMLAATMSAGDYLKVLNTADWSIISQVPIPPGIGESCAFSHDGAYLAAGHYYEDHLTIISTADWSVVSGTPTLPDRVLGLHFSPDGSLLAAAHIGGNNLTILNTTDWSVIANTPNIGGTGYAAAFSPDSSFLVVGQSGSYKVLSTSDWSEIANTPSISSLSDVSTCRFSADGSLLAIGHDYGDNLLMIDVATWTELQGAASMPNDVSGCAFSPDGGVPIPARKIRTLDSGGNDLNASVVVTKRDFGQIGTVESSGETEIELLKGGDYWLFMKDDRPGATSDAFARITLDATSGDLPPLLLSQGYIGDQATISSNLTTQAGAPGDEVVIRNWNTRELVAKVVPDANGDWSAEVPPGTYDVSYIAENCAPVIHGPYTVELP